MDCKSETAILLRGVSQGNNLGRQDAVEGVRGPLEVFPDCRLWRSRSGNDDRNSLLERMALGMDEGFEHELKRIVKPYLDRGRPGDYEHTLRAVAYGKELLHHEDGDEGIVIPALYLHDIGWGEVDFEDFIYLPLPSQRRYVASVDLHMRHGAARAKQILDKLGYPMEETQTVVSIIAVHDRPEKIFAMENPSAIIVFEADYLDKFGLKSLHRFEIMFKDNPGTEVTKKDGAAHLRKGMKVWFKTGTARRLALQLAKESGLLEGI